MSLLLKIVENEGSPVASDNEHAIWADVVSCSFRRFHNGKGAEAILGIREPVKTAMVPGYSEVQKLIDFTGTAYLMNENGRTVSSFPNYALCIGTKMTYQEPDRPALEITKEMIFWGAHEFERVASSYPPERAAVEVYIAMAQMAPDQDGACHHAPETE